MLNVAIWEPNGVDWRRGHDVGQVALICAGQNSSVSCSVRPGRQSDESCAGCGVVHKPDRCVVRLAAIGAEVEGLDCVVHEVGHFAEASTHELLDRLCAGGVGFGWW